MFHKGSDRHFVATSVAKTGRSLNLGMGQFAILDKGATPTNDGLKVISDFKGLSKNSTIQLVRGTAGLLSRSSDNKSYKSLDFKLGEIEQLRVSAPKEGIKVDVQILGWDGFNASTAIVLQPGDNEQIQVTLSGPGIAMAGYEDAQVTVTEYLTAPNSPKATDQTEANAGLWTDQQIIEEAVERLKKKDVMNGVELDTYIKVTPVNSNNPAEGAIVGASPATFYNLTVEDDGTYSDLGLVQSQVSSYKVVRSDVTAEDSVYTIVAPTVSVTAGAFVVGQEYVITSAGTTTFTSIGASANTVGTRFVATGAGTGTGTANVVPVTSFTKNKAWKVKGCADCPTGYTQYSDGIVYSITLEDDGADSTTAVEAISANVEAGSAVRVSQEGGLSTYTFVTSADLTDAEKTAFLTTNPESTIEKIAEDVAEVCAPNNSTTYTWEIGDECNIVTEEYSVIVPHDECNIAPTAEVQAYYPELTIVADSTANCATKYTTDVVSQVVCEECDKDFRDLFVTEAPDAYGVHSWAKAEKVFAFDSLMGIRFEGKPYIFAGNEEYRDFVPEIATSTRIKVAGGYADTISESFSAGNTAGRFALKIMSVASEPENWGMNLRDWEEAGAVYFSGEARYDKNNYANYVLGKETNLGAISPFVDYILKVRKKTRTQSFYGELNETMEYHILVEPGVHVDVEEVLNNLAAEAGIPTVQAFGKTSA